LTDVGQAVIARSAAFTRSASHSGLAVPRSGEHAGAADEAIQSGAVVDGFAGPIVGLLDLGNDLQRVFPG
jgi:hypothetical protein